MTRRNQTDKAIHMLREGYEPEVIADATGYSLAMIDGLRKDLEQGRITVEED